MGSFERSIPYLLDNNLFWAFDYSRKSCKKVKILYWVGARVRHFYFHNLETLHHMVYNVKVCIDFESIDLEKEFLNFLPRKYGDTCYHLRENILKNFIWK